MTKNKLAHLRSPTRNISVILLLRRLSAPVRQFRNMAAIIYRLFRTVNWRQLRACPKGAMVFFCVGLNEFECGFICKRMQNINSIVLWRMIIIAHIVYKGLLGN